QGAAANDHGPQLRIVERDDRNVFAFDVLPDVEFGPVRERKDANVLPLVDPRIVDVPELGALIFGVPLTEFVAEGVNAFLGAGFFLVAARAAKSRVVAPGR